MKQKIEDWKYARVEGKPAWRVESAFAAFAPSMRKAMHWCFCSLLTVKRHPRQIERTAKGLKMFHSTVYRFHLLDDPLKQLQPFENVLDRWTKFVETKNLSARLVCVIQFGCPWKPRLEVFQLLKHFKWNLPKSSKHYSSASATLVPPTSPIHYKARPLPSQESIGKFSAWSDNVFRCLSHYIKLVEPSSFAIGIISSRTHVITVEKRGKWENIF